MRAAILKRTLFTFSLIFCAGAYGAEAPATPPPAGLEPAPEPPLIPEQVESGQALEPEVTITRRGADTVQEYRLSGRLYMVKILPSSGAPYYLIDTDGDGQMETRQNDVRTSKVPQWVLFSWE
ncbi:MAG: DUF2782 domain-containing protein [Proteobacteria bacterium]|nr:DUF2782 domain-containing protein [Pseudomonadota bacterium]